LLKGLRAKLMMENSSNDFPVFSHWRFIREKDGVLLARAKDEAGKSWVIKTFRKPEFRREIQAYELLQSLGVRTLRWQRSGQESIALEDLNTNPHLRLANPEDMDDPSIAVNLAVWYRQLHEAGSHLNETILKSLYSEINFFNLEAFSNIAKATNSEKLHFWKFLDENYGQIQGKLNFLQPTLTYNDFYYVNMAVMRDGPAALMFDYNFLGWGYRAMDLLNVQSSLSPITGASFRDAYGEVDAKEELACRFLCPLTSIAMAIERPSLPAWFEEEWQKLTSGELEKTIRDFLG